MRESWAIKAILMAELSPYSGHRVAVNKHIFYNIIYAQKMQVQQPQKLTKNAPPGQVLSGLPKQYRKILVKQRAAVVL